MGEWWLYPPCSPLLCPGKQGHRKEWNKSRTAQQELQLTLPTLQRGRVRSSLYPLRVQGSPPSTQSYVSPCDCLEVGLCVKDPSDLPHSPSLSLIPRGLVSRAPSAQRNIQQSYHSNVGLENLLYKLVPGRVDQLDDVPMQGVSVLLQEAWQQRTVISAPTITGQGLPKPTTSKPEGPLEFTSLTHTHSPVWALGPERTVAHPRSQRKRGANPQILIPTRSLGRKYRRSLSQGQNEAPFPTGSSLSHCGPFELRCQSPAKESPEGDYMWML